MRTTYLQDLDSNIDAALNKTGLDFGLCNSDTSVNEEIQPFSWGPGLARSSGKISCILFILLPTFCQLFDHGLFPSLHHIPALPF